VIAALALLATLAVAIATAVSFLRDWRAALLVHFRPHLAAVALLCLLVDAVVNLPIRFGVVAPLAASIVVLVNLYEIVRATPRGAAIDGERRLRLAFANVLRSNHDAQRLIDWVRREKVDLLVVAEAVNAWPRQLAVLADELPFIVNAGAGDVAIYSRHEIAGEPHHIYVGIGCAVVVEVAGLHLVGLHTASPEGRARSVACAELIDRAGAYVEGLDGPMVMVGDFNATPWSWPVRRLIARTGLGYGPGARLGTFPADRSGWRFPVWVGIPIDLVLAGRGAVVVARRHGPRIGSDHWPVVAEIQYFRRLDPSDPRP
jgi:endonuclease/exonuclease/phosphatase (EEP) superfamily protein YafD